MINAQRKRNFFDFYKIPDESRGGTSPRWGIFPMRGLRGQKWIFVPPWRFWGSVMICIFSKNFKVWKKLQQIPFKYPLRARKWSILAKKRTCGAKNTHTILKIVQKVPPKSPLRHLVRHPSGGIGNESFQIPPGLGEIGKSGEGLKILWKISKSLHPLT